MGFKYNERIGKFLKKGIGYNIEKRMYRKISKR